MFELIGRCKAITAANLFRFEPIDANTQIGDLVARLINWVLWFAFVLAVIYLIYSGILYITAGGDSEKATKGRTGVINAVIGIIIILLALAIVTWVANTLVNNI